MIINKLLIVLIGIIFFFTRCHNTDNIHKTNELITITHKINGSARMWVELDTTDWNNIDFIGTYTEHYELSNNFCEGCSINRDWIFKGYQSGTDTITFIEYSSANDLNQPKVTNNYIHVIQIE